MNIFDTKKQLIVPFTASASEVRMYICGVTPYDSAHLGHIFTFLTYDLLQRRLEDMGMTVRMVRNITDVDEPIFKRAAENNEPYTELARREIASFQAIMRELNFKQPAAEPLASEYIEEMSAAVARLLDGGHAYRLGDDVYFDVSTFPSFGGFSGLPRRLQVAFMADRGGDPERAGKRSPLDFLLWRGVTDETDHAAWKSPVGYGRPGWHIECSVMSSALLGTPIDLHGGGMDLIFPHHECEIAQSESLGAAQFSKHWMHVAPMLLYGEKMSKSLGNLVFARDLLQDAGAAAVRLALFNYHYRSGGEWRYEAWHEAKRLAHDLHDALGHPQTYTVQRGLLDKVRDALDDNLNTPRILSLLRMHLRAHGDVRELRETLELLGVSF